MPKSPHIDPPDVHPTLCYELGTRHGIAPSIGPKCFFELDRVVPGAPFTLRFTGAATAVVLSLRDAGRSWIGILFDDGRVIAVDCLDDAEAAAFRQLCDSNRIPHHDGEPLAASPCPPPKLSELGAPAWDDAIARWKAELEQYAVPAPTTR